MTTRTPTSTRGHAHRLALSTLSLALLAAACSTLPDGNPALEQARSRLASAQGDPEVVALASPELTRARDALQRADRARSDGADVQTVDHLSYLATQHVVIAEETARSRAAQAVTAGAAAERDRLRLDQRTQQADRAERALADADRLNARQGEQLASAERVTVRTAAELAAAELENDRRRADLLQSEARARDERARVAERDARVSDLEGQLRAINARKTERGIVVTLGDLLFDSGRAGLQAGGLHSMERLAEFLQRNPSRRAVIEGYTDSAGSDEFNRDLSDRRAHAVMDALVARGVNRSRLSTEAFGEGRPVADNATAQGRQLNRRVEVVFAAESGDLLSK